MITAKRFSAEGQVQARRLSTEGKKLDDIAKVVGSPSSVVWVQVTETKEVSAVSDR